MNIFGFRICVGKSVIIAMMSWGFIERGQFVQRHSNNPRILKAYLRVFYRSNMHCFHLISIIQWRLIFHEHHIIFIWFGYNLVLIQAIYLHMQIHKFSDVIEVKVVDDMLCCYVRSKSPFVCTVYP